MEVGGQHHAPVSLPQERIPVPTEQEIAWAPENICVILLKIWISIFVSRYLHALWYLYKEHFNHLSLTRI
jgi:hypothetical protein